MDFDSKAKRFREQMLDRGFQEEQIDSFIESKRSDFNLEQKEAQVQEKQFDDELFEDEDEILEKDVNRLKLQKEKKELESDEDAEARLISEFIADAVASAAQGSEAGSAYDVAKLAILDLQDTLGIELTAKEISSIRQQANDAWEKKQITTEEPEGLSVESIGSTALEGREGGLAQNPTFQRFFKDVYVPGAVAAGKAGLKNTPGLGVAFQAADTLRTRGPQAFEFLFGKKKK